MNTNSIRVRASAVFIHQGKILVHVVENRDDGKVWLIPPGGGLRYGESSFQALEREIREELGWSILVESLIGSFESFHSVNGMEEHEISFVYRARPSSTAEFAFSSREIVEDNGKRKTLQWFEIESITDSKHLLYPQGLLEKVSI